MNAAKFNDFINEIHKIVDNANGDEPTILSKTEVLLKNLLAKDDWLADRYTKPHPEYYQQYCLYACPKDSFSVVSFVWGPGQSTPVHDHTVWGVIGVLRGAENGVRYVKNDDGTYSESSSDVLKAGMTDCVSPSIGDVHKVSNALEDEVSISIHIYGANIGKIKRHVIIPETGEVKEFVSGYAEP